MWLEVRTFSSIPGPLRRERVWRLSSVISGPWFNKSLLLINSRAYIKAFKLWGSEGIRFEKHVHLLIGWLPQTLWRQTLLCSGPAGPHPLHLFIWLIAYILYNKLVSKYCFLCDFVNHSNNLMHLSGGRVYGRPCDLVAKLNRNMGNPGTQYLELAFEVRAVLWDWDAKPGGF